MASHVEFSRWFHSLVDLLSRTPVSAIVWLHKLEIIAKGGQNKMKKVYHLLPLADLLLQLKPQIEAALVRIERVPRSDRLTQLKVPAAAFNDMVVLDDPLKQLALFLNMARDELPLDDAEIGQLVASFDAILKRIKVIRVPLTVLPRRYETMAKLNLSHSEKEYLKDKLSVADFAGRTKGVCRTYAQNFNRNPVEYYKRLGKGARHCGDRAECMDLFDFQDFRRRSEKDYAKWYDQSLTVKAPDTPLSNLEMATVCNYLLHGQSQL